MRPVVGREAYRSEARRDKARLIHSPAFRRLQGKTQLFPGLDSDFFRNRLTHSLEVAQIAESIAFKLNHENQFFRANPIDPEICIVAALAHDLGHPPFGHNGEAALDDCMKDHGGFEGNAQTLRILTRLEKKQAADALPCGVDENGKDHRAGLNLTYRTLASILKYDSRIPAARNRIDPIHKGYYDCDKTIVSRIREKVAGRSVPEGKFRTIECSIMDISDDIAYSTYDLEDSFKAGFITPLSILESSDSLRARVAKIVADRLNIKFTADDVLLTFFSIFKSIFPRETIGRDQIAAAVAAIESFGTAKELAGSGYARTNFTAELISRIIGGVEATINTAIPALSQARLKTRTATQVEVLKRFNYEATIMSSRLKVTEHRGYQIVQNIFESIAGHNGSYLLPDDFREIHDRVKEISEKRRVICDFVCGMTDRYAVEFYARLNSEQPQSIFKPL